MVPKRGQIWIGMKDILAKLVAGATLSEAETQRAFEHLISAQAEPVQVGAFLALLAMREPTVDELAGAAQVMRRYVVPIEAPPEVIDTCGTGGTGSRIFNVSTAAALVAAACGVPVAKHGNRAVTSRSGSADVLRVLGVHVEAAPDIQKKCLEQVGICFAFAQQHHPAMRNVAHARKVLGLATIFNLMGPLINPAGARRQLAGVPRPTLTEKILTVFMRLGAKRAMVVCGQDPAEGFLCELSIGGPTQISLFDGKDVRGFALVPEDVGLVTAKSDALRIDSPAASAGLIRKILAGQAGPARDIVLLNAGAALWVAGKAQSIRDGIKMAAEAIASHQAQNTLANLVRISHS